LKRRSEKEFHNIFGDELLKKGQQYMKDKSKGIPKYKEHNIDDIIRNGSFKKIYNYHK
jgi:hypothetical protein